MRIYQVAAFKDKIQHFGITDPFIIFFLQKYENIIPWEEMSSYDDINAYYEEIIKSILKVKTDLTQNSYLKQLKKLKKDLKYNSDSSCPPFIRSRHVNHFNDLLFKI